jgi:hypothetical protein
VDGHETPYILQRNHNGWMDRLKKKNLRKSNSDCDVVVNGGDWLGVWMILLFAIGGGK